MRTVQRTKVGHRFSRLNDTIPNVVSVNATLADIGRNPWPVYFFYYYY